VHPYQENRVPGGADGSNRPAAGTGKGKMANPGWGIFGLAGVALAASLVTWDDPAAWYRITNQAQPGRIIMPAQDSLPQAAGGFCFANRGQSKSFRLPFGIFPGFAIGYRDWAAGKTVNRGRLDVGFYAH